VSVRFDLPLDVQEQRTPLVWACLDTRGNIYARSNDGTLKRYRKKKVRKGHAPDELEAIFEALYPDVPLPDLALPSRPETRQRISFRE
jgi:hypothetical protein